MCDMYNLVGPTRLLSFLVGLYFEMDLCKIPSKHEVLHQFSLHCCVMDGRIQGMQDLIYGALDTRLK